MGFTADVFGNPIYGVPDVGAIECQPPYRMGSDALDIAGHVRVYGDGTFRCTASPARTAAQLTIEPEGGWPTNDYREWMNVVLNHWSATAMTRLRAVLSSR